MSDWRDREETRLREMLAQLHRDYQREAKPIIQRLVQIENTRVRPIIILPTPSVREALSALHGGPVASVTYRDQRFTVDSNDPMNVIVSALHGDDDVELP